MNHAVTIDETTAVIDIACLECNTNHTVVLDKERYIKWQTRTRIQEAFHGIDVDTRELLISGICGKCFDLMCDRWELEEEKFGTLPDNDYFMET